MFCAIAVYREFRRARLLYAETAAPDAYRADCQCFPKRSPFGLQEVAFCGVKGCLSWRKRRSFAVHSQFRCKSSYVNRTSKTSNVA